MVKTINQESKEKKENINTIKKKVLKKKSSYKTCSYKYCTGKNCGIKNILSSWVLVKEIIDDKIKIYPAYLSCYDGGFEVINPSCNLNRQMSMCQTTFFQEQIDTMTDTEKNQLMTKEEYIASLHN